MPFYAEIRLAVKPRRALRAIIDREKPDYIHILTEGPIGLAARAICRQRGMNFTTSYHTHFHLYVHERLPYSEHVVLWLLRRFHNAAARTFVTTDGLVRYLSGHGFRKVVRAPIGINTDFFNHRPLPNPPNLARPIFAYAGRVAGEKNIEEFLALDLPGSKLVIGDGPDRHRLERRNEALFVGYKRGTEFVE